MDLGTFCGIAALSCFALAVFFGVGWAVVKIVSEVADCDEDPESYLPEGDKPEVVNAGYHASAELHPPCRT